MRLTRATAAITLAAALALLSPVAPALAHGSLRGAVLKLSDATSDFNATATHYYTSYAYFLDVKVNNGQRKVDLTCASPSNLIYPAYSQAMVEAFGHTAKIGLQDMRVCAFLYSSNAKAHQAFSGLVKSGGGNAKLFGSKAVSVHIANESQAFTSKFLYTAIFRSDNYLAYYFYGNPGSLHMSWSTFLGLSGKLISHLT
jgi:hypothetical protein